MINDDDDDDIPSGREDENLSDTENEATNQLDTASLDDDDDDDDDDECEASTSTR